MTKNLYFFVFSLLLLSCNSTKKNSTLKTTPEATKEKAKNSKHASKDDPIMVIKGPDTLSTASGLRYVIFKHSSGSRKPASGEHVFVHYRGQLNDGTEFDNSYKRGEPYEFILGTGKVIKGWEEGIALLSEGDSALLIIPPALGYGTRGLAGIPPNSTLYFMVELVKIKAPVFAVEFPYQGKQLHTTPSGLKYYIVEEGTGKQAYAGSHVKVHYTGYLIDGKIFDSSILREEPYEFELGVGQVIKGWDEGILMMRVGSKYRFIIPPSLAYGSGEAGAGTIKANSTLIFDCELMEVQ